MNVYAKMKQTSDMENKVVVTERKREKGIDN